MAGCSSESPAQPGLNGLDEFQESLTKESTPVSFPDACELVDEPGLRLLEGNALARKDRSENDYSVSCEKWTEPEEGGVSSLTVMVSAIPAVREGETGVMFPEPTVESLVDALARVSRISFDAGRLHDHANRFSRERHAEGLRAIINETMGAPAGSRW